MDSTIFAKPLMNGLQFLLSAIFPELCLQCGNAYAEKGLLCRRCESPNGKTYEGSFKTIFAAAKFTKRRRALNYFITNSAAELGELSAGATVFLPIPSSSPFLASTLRANVAHEKLYFDAFKFSKKSRTRNKLLGEAERYKNIYESLLWSAKQIPPAEKYVICDDVTTTGATLNQARDLAQQNLGEVKIVTWAIAERPRYFLIPRQ